MDKIPLVSIIIPMRNEKKNAVRCLDSLRNQNFTNIEIIVVDDGSTDNTVKLSLQYADKVIPAERKGISSAKNIGIKNSKGDYIVFTDADCVVSKDWLVELLKGFNEEGIVSVGGPNLNISTRNILSESIDGIFYFLSKLGFRYGACSENSGFVEHNPGCNVIYKKSIFQKVGLFNENLITAEDEEMDYRIIKNGYKIYYMPGAKVQHFRRDSFASFLKQLYRYSVGKMQFIRQYPGKARFLFFIPSLSLLIFSGFIASLYFIYPARSFLKTALIASCMTIVGASCYISACRGVRIFFYILILLPLGFLTCGIGFIAGVFKKT
jgi:cellulose synthase/poly-beta-1,6-N-acetylglucosamine synthase-like glycosyltransferase